MTVTGAWVNCVTSRTEMSGGRLFGRIPTRTDERDQAEGFSTSFRMIPSLSGDCQLGAHGFLPEEIIRPRHHLSRTNQWGWTIAAVSPSHFPLRPHARKSQTIRPEGVTDSGFSRLASSVGCARRCGRHCGNSWSSRLPRTPLVPWPRRHYNFVLRFLRLLDLSPSCVSIAHLPLPCVKFAAVIVN
jgi:hypothetical protein